MAMIALLAMAPSSQAESLRERPKAVVELFTSQGCSSCPPADALLSSLGKDDDVIALAFHVDYWDYVGWKDTFGDPANSDRQRAYAKSWGTPRIYTPQMVVNGKQDVVGSRRAEVHSAIRSASLILPVDIESKAGMLEVEIGPHAGTGDAVVWLVTYLRQAQVQIERGENAGKSMSYTQVVTGRHMLGMWEGEAGARFKLPLAELAAEAGDGIAVIVQEDRNGLPGAILGAASYER
ncbi:MAG: hypothetical protein K0R85_2312 [Devosia sp.]|jgi:hypothetical protein|nr:hypothetical protein [Devosia sp.]